MATSQASFKWTDGKLINLIKCTQEFKSSMEFKNCGSNAGKVKLYENVKKSQEEICESEAYGLASASENPYKDLDVNDIDLREYQVVVKTEKEQIKRGSYRI